MSFVGPVISILRGKFGVGLAERSCYCGWGRQRRYSLLFGISILVIGRSW